MNTQSGEPSSQGSSRVYGTFPSGQNQGQQQQQQQQYTDRSNRESVNSQPTLKGTSLEDNERTRLMPIGRDLSTASNTIPFNSRSASIRNNPPKVQTSQIPGQTR
jgi:hypothetical protein